MLEEYTGSIVEMIFHNSENGYTVAVFETEAEEFTIVGNLPLVNVGQSYRLTGEFVEHATYGEQFAVKHYEEVMPSTKEGIRDFLSSGVLKGVGPKTATAIVNHFGAETLNVIEKTPGLLTNVPGIGEKTAARVAEAFAAHREFANVSLHLQKYGISATYTLKLYQAYGADTVDVVEQNPYCLINDVHGIGFRKADSIAEKVGIEKDDEFRIQSGVRYTLAYFASEGSTYLPETELCERAAELLDQPIEIIRQNLEAMAFAGDVQPDVFDGQRVVYLMGYYMAEQIVCRNLRQINEAQLKPINGPVESLIQRTEASTGIALSEQQKRAVTSCLGTGVSVITGGPGTGKTTIINAIINILEDSGFKTAIAAPTGRAAKRITETSGHEASTIHRLLEYSFFESGEAGFASESSLGDSWEANDAGGYMRFGRNEENPLEYDAVVIDEASMIDLLLMRGLTNAIRPGTRLIIVGDSDQLPSVGAGNVLRDIIDSEYIYCTQLTEIFRQAKESMIVVNAHRINHGEYPDCNAKEKDFFLMRRQNERDMLETIKELCLTRLPEYYRDLVPGGLNPVRDIQVLTPVRKGMLGCISMNADLQQVLNPPSPDKVEKRFGDRVFREGDKVMQIRNNYEMKWKDSSDFSDGEGVFNGDVGFVQHIDTEFNEVTVVFDDTRHVTYNYTQLDELELAYAVTVHKSQGSEFPIVVMPMSWFPPVLATRNLLYTGVTRGKQIVVMVGSEDRMRAMVDNDRIRMRYSGLGRRLAALLTVNI